MESAGILTLVMGQTGTGRSRFINIAAGRNLAPVGKGIQSCTKQPESYSLSHPSLNDPSRLVVLVDTPGFNAPDPTADSNALDHSVPDTKHLEAIIQFLEKRAKMKFGGIIYLNDVTQPECRMLQRLRRNATIEESHLFVITKKNHDDQPNIDHAEFLLPANGRAPTPTTEYAWAIIDGIVDRTCPKNLTVHDICTAFYDVLSQSNVPTVTTHTKKKRKGWGMFAWIF